MPRTYINEDGYRCFWDSGIPVHRWEAEKKLGRRLRPGEVVHHKDRNKLNNSWDNLWVFPNQEAHYEAHLDDAEEYGWDYSFNGETKSYDDDDFEEEDDDDLPY